MITLVEAVYASGSVNELLLARKERVAGGADFNADVALVGRAGGKGVAACTMHAHFTISRMNRGFHDCSGLECNLLILLEAGRIHQG